MKRKIDLTGLKFGKLTVIEFIGMDNHGNSLWLCRCECGNITKVRKDHLIKGNTQSCGCLKKEKISKRNKENAIHNLSKTRLYRIYKGMINRCYQKITNGYENYGGRNITVCQEWLDDFMNFYNWAIQNNYNDNLTLDRINVNDNYKPSNCKFSTTNEQQNNRRNNFFITYNNETHTLMEWSKILNINYNTLSSRIKKYNWTIKKAFTKEVEK